MRTKGTRHEPDELSGQAAGWVTVEWKDLDAIVAEIEGKDIEV